MLDLRPDSGSGVFMVAVERCRYESGQWRMDMMGDTNGSRNSVATYVRVAQLVKLRSAITGGLPAVSKMARAF